MPAARALRAAGFFVTDRNQVKEERDGLYCEAASLFFQARLVPALTPLVAMEIQPSYTWLFRYRPGAQLERHTDRPQCRWNLSLLVDDEADTEDTRWPLFFEGAEGRRGVDLEMGDAVLYSGTDTPHWRERLVGDTGITLMLCHYVDQTFRGSLA